MRSGDGSEWLITKDGFGGGQEKSAVGSMTSDKVRTEVLGSRVGAVLCLEFILSIWKPPSFGGGDASTTITQKFVNKKHIDAHTLV